MLDSVSNNIKGEVHFYTRGAGDKDFKFESKHNLVVVSSRKIMRDLVLGKDEQQRPAPTITYLGLGDMNLTLDQANIQVPVVNINDTELVHPTFWVPVEDHNFPNNSKTHTTMPNTGNPAVKYTFYLSRQQANTTSGFFCELGLAINYNTYPTEYLFTKLNRPPLVKTDNDEIIINYYLAF